MAAMLGWLRLASTCASRSKRAIRAASSAKASSSTLIATSRFSLVSVARYTTPIPPSPSFDVILWCAMEDCWAHGARLCGMVSPSDQMEPRVLWERVADHSKTAPLAVKPAYRRLAPDTADPTPEDHAIHPRSPVGGRGTGGEHLGRLTMARSRSDCRPRRVERLGLLHAGLPLASSSAACRSRPRSPAA